MSALPDPQTPFGRRVRERLAGDPVIWLTTVAADGTPVPNPVWFVWEPSGDSPDEPESIVVYNVTTAHRLAHIAARPQVSLNLNTGEHGDDVVVARGLAEPAPEMPPADDWQPYTDKYGPAMRQVSGSEAAFAEAYSAPVRIRLLKVRGF